MSENIPGPRGRGGERFYSEWFRRRGDSIVLQVEDLQVAGPTAESAVETRPISGAAMTKAVSPANPLFVRTAHGMAKFYFKEYRGRRTAIEATCSPLIRPDAGPGDPSKASQQP